MTNPNKGKVPSRRRVRVTLGSSRRVREALDELQQEKQARQKLDDLAKEFDDAVEAKVAMIENSEKDQAP